LFLPQECTVLFADISGFTAWSSTREPSQVFTLLETIYHEFDTIAKRRRVFKVETVGDCYVAVAGLPEARKDHAVVMSRFARDCIIRMSHLTRKLEVQLGPDTTELAMRVGLHSGPVTAGVLRGERARFQLFGDTVNTASRMESTGRRDSIQISQVTANILVAAGKQHWITAREDKVVAKGKGELQTYWLDVKVTRTKVSAAGASEISDEEMKHLEEVLSDSFTPSTSFATQKSLSQVVSDQLDIRTVEGKRQRLIDWNMALLLKQLRLIVASEKTWAPRPTHLRGSRLSRICVIVRMVPCWTKWLIL
jgi:class 3 adenylate cyclase